MTKKELWLQRDYGQSEAPAEVVGVDFVVVSGDAYVDHPSFGSALIGRLVQSLGFCVGVIAQPKKDADFCEFGAPKHGFLLAGGVVDSMVNNYYVSKKKRTEDEYSEGGVYGNRPDRCVDVYAKTLKRLYPDCPIIAGGLEASLRRLAHYDYWDDSVRKSILWTSGVDIVVYGMGENPMFDLLEYAKKGVHLGKVRDVKGTAYLASLDTVPKKVGQKLQEGGCKDLVVLPSCGQVSADKKAYFEAFDLSMQGMATADKTLVQWQDERQFVVVNPPSSPLTQAQMDSVYALPFERTQHPRYKERVPALQEVEFSVTAHRGCFGDCAFCAITYHQGRIVQSRSEDNIIQECESLVDKPGFKGYIHDIGGPTANFHEPACDKQAKHGVCANRECVGGDGNCNQLKVDHTAYLSLLRRARSIKGVKKVFVRSGVRFDYIMSDMDQAFLQELAKHHISGQLKVAPEHASDSVLKHMNKPHFATYLAFKQEFEKATKACGMAKQYLVPYFISSHPGCTIADAVTLTEYLKEINYMPLQVQDFYPTPSTLATTMYYTEMDKNHKPIFVAKKPHDKAMQRALLQWRLPKNKALIEEAYKLAKGVGTHGKNTATQTNTQSNTPSNTHPSTRKPTKTVTQAKSPNKSTLLDKAYGRPKAHKGKKVVNRVHGKKRRK
ncbi:MAG: YgiQ family radical SAM protein [Firmicutes bacterium]|nr:YgiQ family radical SAM protein [Bacillota bacterium]